MADYDQVARAYEAHVVPQYLAIAKGLAARSDFQASSRVLEVGAGTGLLTRLLIPRTPRLVITDISQPMLRYAPSVLGDIGLKLPVIAAASVDRLPFRSEVFDVVASNLTPLQDTMIALREAMRVLRPGGRMILSMWGPSYAEVRLLNLALREVGKPHAPYGGPLRAVKRMTSLGLSVKREDVELMAEYDSVEAYIEYRNAFGYPSSWSDDDLTRYLNAIRILANKLATGDSLRLGWNVTYLIGTKKPIF